MFKITCKDVGSMDCSFETTGETKEEVMQKLMTHAQEAHPDAVKKMSESMSPEQMNAMVLEKITEV